MNPTERKILNTFPTGLDAAITMKFGSKVEACTEYSFMEMKFVTTFRTRSKKLKAQIDAFVEGFMAGNHELVKRLDRGTL